MATTAKGIYYPTNSSPVAIQSDLQQLSTTSDTAIFNKSYGLQPGELIGRTSTGFQKIPSGSEGQYLTADSTSSTGVSWQTPSAFNYHLIYQYSGDIVANTFSITDIPQTYKDIEVVISGVIGSGATNALEEQHTVAWWVNSPSSLGYNILAANANNYSIGHLRISGGSDSSTENSANEFGSNGIESSIAWSDDNGTGTAIPGHHMSIYFSNYTSSSLWKNAWTSISSKNTQTTDLHTGWGATTIKTTSPITSFSFGNYAAAGLAPMQMNFTSWVRVYGIK